MVTRIRRAVLILSACLLLFLSACGRGGDSTEGTEETSAATAGSETTAVTEAIMNYPPTTAPTAEQITNHEKILLWPEDNIPYDIENEEKGLKPTIRAYLCEGSDSAVVIFPGGGYFQLSDESEGVAVAQAYNAQGFNAFVVNYRYEPYDGRATLADGQRAVQYVRYFAETGVFAGIDPEKIAVCGFSAGGHLAVMVAQHAAENTVGDIAGAQSSLPNACVLVYPVTTLGDGTYETMPRIFLADRQTDEAEIAKYSYPYHLKSMPATFVCYSVKDTLVDYQKNSVALYDAMTAEGMDAVIKEYTDAPHGCGLGIGFDDFSKWLADSAQFLQDRGY